MKINQLQIAKYFTLTLILLFTFETQAGNYTWTGVASTNWSDTSNWSPSGTVPGSSDSVTITSGTNNCVLSANVTVTKLTVSTDTLDLNHYTLSVTSNFTITGGFVSTGTLSIYGSGTCSFSGGTISSLVSATGNSVLFSGTSFTNSVTAVKKSSTTSTGNGGCNFSSPVTLIDSGSGFWTLANSNSDTWADRVTVKQTSSGTIFFAHNSNGNTFAKAVTFTNSSSGKIYCDYYGQSEFADSIIVNSTSTGGIYFGVSSGITTLDTSRIVIGSLGLNSSSTLHLGGILQNDATKSISLTATGTASIFFGQHSIFDGVVTASAPGLFLNGSRFNNKVTLTHTGSNSNVSEGGCYFGDSTWIEHNNSSGGTFFTGNKFLDSLMGKTTIQNSVKGTVGINNANFGNHTIFKNFAVDASLSGASSLAGTYTFVIGSSSICTFFDTLILVNDSASSLFGTTKVTHTAVFENNSALIIDSSYTGNLFFRYTNYQSTSPINFPLGNNFGRLYLDTNNIFEADVSIKTQKIQLNGSTFNGDFNLIYCGIGNDTCKGGNVFNGTTTINDTNSVSHTNLLLACNYPDDFNGDVVFKQFGAGAIFPCRVKNSTFAQDITVDGSSAITFGGGGGKVILDGSGDKMLLKISSYPPTFKKLQLNKSGTFTLAIPLTVTDSLIFSNGFLQTDSFYILKLADNCIVTGASDNSYVEGSVKKTGNDAFTFPLGDAGKYHPLTISAPSNATDAFSAKYVYAPPVVGTVADTTFDNVSTCEYWKLDRDTGSSSVTVKLGWNTNSCNVFGADSMRVAFWDTSALKWKNKGNGGITGNTSVGTVVSSSVLSSFGYFTLADSLCTAIDVTIFSLNENCMGYGDGSANAIPAYGTTPYSYSWSPSGGSSATAASLSPGTYTVTITDDNNCTTIDSTTIVTRDPLDFTWLGGTSSDWDDPSNWSMPTPPFPCDNVVLYGGFSYSPQLTSDIEITGFINYGENLDLNSYTLNIMGDAEFNAGNISNGELEISNSQTTFAGTVFDSKIICKADDVYIGSSVFNDSLTIIKQGASDNYCIGRNEFHSVITIIDSGAGNIYLANDRGDDFNSSVEFINAGSGKIYPSYSQNSTFAGDINVGGNSAVEFGANGGLVIFDDAQDQALTKSGSYVPIFNKMELNKTSGVILLGYPLTLYDTLFLTQGVLATDSINLLTVPDNGVITGGSDSAFVHGPVKKVGNDSFIFTLGDTALNNYRYHPLFISEPDSTNDSFTAQFFGLSSGITSSPVDIFINDCQFWTISHPSGNSDVKIGLGTNIYDCNKSNQAEWLVVAKDSLWTNLGKDSISIFNNAIFVIGNSELNIPNNNKYSVLVGNSLLVSTPTYRGMYVNKFLTFDNTGTILDPANTILGNSTREDELLQFAKDNNIKYLILYGLRNVWNNSAVTYPNDTRTYAQVLCDFIINAKDNYCIEQIGAAHGSSSRFDQVYNFNNGTIPVSAPYYFSTNSIFSILNPNPLSFVSQQYSSSDGPIAVKAEIVKEYLRLNDYNNSIAAACAGKIDVMVTEYEFWDNNPAHCPIPAGAVCDLDGQWDAYETLLFNMNVIRSNSNQVGQHPLLIDVYLGWFHFDSYNDQTQINYIDNIVDRVFLHAYTANPSSAFNYLDANSRLTMFGNSQSKPNTNLVPLFSNEHTGDEGNNFQGHWLDNNNAFSTQTPHTIFEAEQILRADVIDDIDNNSAAIVGDSYVGGIDHANTSLNFGPLFTWFAYSYFSSITSQWPYNTCTNNEIFYQGGTITGACSTSILFNPIIACKNDNVTFKYVGNYEDGVTCDWIFGDGGTSNGQSPGDQSHQYNTPGNFIVKCELSFPSSIVSPPQTCEYTFERPIIVGGSIITSNGPAFCVGDQINLHADAFGIAPITYQWKLNGTNIAGATLADYNFTASTGGTYTCVTSDANCSGEVSNSITITVNALPTASITGTETSGNTNNDGILCAGDQILLNSNATAGSGTITGYSWLQSGGTGATATVTTAGNYTVTVTNSNGCSFTSTAYTVSVNAIPTASISGTETSGNTNNDGILCAGDQILLNSNATAGSGTILSYSWSPSGGTGATANVSTAGNYTVTVTNSNGCSFTSSAYTVTVNAIPTASISGTETSGNTNNDGILCAGDQILLNSNAAAGSGTISSYSWSPSGGAGATANVSTAGNYSVTVTNSNGCSFTSSAYTVTVNAIPTASISGTETSGNTNNDGILCAGDQILLNSNAAAGSGTISSYSWSPSGGTGATANVSTAGNYTVTVTNSNGCSFISSAYAVTVNAIPTSSISGTETSGNTNNDGILCAGDQILLNSNAAAGSGTISSYSWSPSGGAGPTATISSSGNFTVTITNSNGCSFTSSAYTVTVNSLPTINAGSNASICIGASTNLSASGAISYSWSPTSGLSNANISNPTATPQATTNYTVTGTDANGCTNSDVVTVTINETCCGSATSEIPLYPDNSTNVVTPNTDYNLNGGLLFPREIGASGAITLTWTGNTIYCGPGTSIIVHSGSSLTLTNCHLLACGDMWKGIIVEDGGTIILNNTTIEDAASAVDMIEYTGNLEIYDSHFINNLIGVYYESVATGSTSGRIFICERTIFEGTGSMKPHFDAGATVGNVPLAGIIIFDVDYTIGTGSTSSSPVYFYNMNSGLVNFTCNANISNSKFEDITSDAAYSTVGGIFNGYDFSGCGFYADDWTGGRSFEITGFGKTSVTKTFDNCTKGVSFFVLDGIVQDCAMDNMESGVIGMYSYANNISITDNAIQATRYGINLEMRDGDQGIQIVNNDITIGSTNNYNISGIRISNFGLYTSSTSTNSNYQITHNNIDMQDNVSHGIELLNAHNFNVLHNSVDFTDNNSQLAGISLVNSGIADISCNSSESSDLGGYPISNQAGIYSSSSENVNYGCNILDQTTNGFRFENGGGYQQLYGNIFNDHDKGLEITTTGVIASQPLNINTTNLPANFWSGICALGANCDGGFGLYRFNDIPAAYANTVTTFSPNGWFLFYNKDNFNCALNNLNGGMQIHEYCYEGPINNFILGDTIIHELDWHIAQNTLSFESYDDQINWGMRKYLFNKLSLDTLLISTDSLFENFYDSIKVTNVNEFRNVELTRNNFFETDSTERAQLYLNKQNISALLDSLGGRVALLADTTISDSIHNIIRAQLVLIKCEIDTLDSIVAVKVQDLLNNTLGMSNDAIEINNGISSGLDIEQNQIDVNEIYLNMIANSLHGLDSASANTIYNIAIQCPYSGGESVYQARALYLLFDKNIQFDDSDCVVVTDTCAILVPGIINGPLTGQCGKTNVTYSIDSIPGVAEYSWSVSDTNAAELIGPTNLRSVNINFSDSTKYVVLFVATTNSCGKSVVRTLTILSVPSNPESIAGNQSVCDSSIQQYSIDSLYGATTYNWIVPSGATILDTLPYDTSILVQWGSTSGNVQILASNSCGYSDTIALAVNIDCRQAQSLTNSNSSRVFIYPNPATHKVVVRYKLEAETGRFELYNQLGQLLNTFIINKNQKAFEFDVSGISNSVINYRLIDGEASADFGKIVILRE